MGYFPVSYDSRVVIYERKMFIRLATEICSQNVLRFVNYDRGPFIILATGGKHLL